MSRKKQVDFLRTELIVNVQDTVIYDKNNGIASLKTKPEQFMAGGIPVTVEQLGYDQFKIITRGHYPKYAIQDYAHIVHYVEQTYGEITKCQILGRPVTGQRKLQYYIPYMPTPTGLKPINEWEQNYQSFTLS